mgnify:CR=1 FL=1
MYECVIVIPTYNAGDFIFKNIQIYKQLDKTKYKVLLVDNGTTDPQSLERLEKIKNENGIDMLYKMLKESDPKYAKQVNNSDEKRIIRALEVFKDSGNNFSSMVGYKNKDYLESKFSIHQFGILDEDRLLLHSRIEQRLEMIIQNGLIDEVKGLLNKYKIPENHPIRRSVNYKQAISFLNNEYDSDEFFKRSLYATRQLAKRQMTWLRSWDDLDAFNIKTSYKIQESIKRLATSL